MRITLALGFILLLSACVAAAKVDPGVQNIHDSYKINTGRSWSRISATPDLWTIDGISLGRLQTWAKVEAGQTLLDSDNLKLPAFRPELTEFELAEMLADTIEVVTGGSDVTISKLESKSFGGADGFGFELAYVDKGLPMKGWAFGAVRDAKLDLMLFTAPREYYFEYYKPEVEQIFGSVSTI